MKQRFVTAFALCALLAGCGEVGPQDDAAVANRVLQRLRSEPALAGSNLQARSEGGNVVLSGTVPSAAERKQAEDIADDVPGVDGVINQIEVAAAGAPPGVGAAPPAEPNFD